MGKKPKIPAIPNATPQRVTVDFTADTARLYGPLPEAIKYLQEVMAEFPTAELGEHWAGHEDMELQFSYQRAETAAEVDKRLADERRLREAVRQDAERVAKRMVKLKEFNRLKRELGL